MKEQQRSRSICIVFVILIFGLFVATLVKKEKTFSSSENRTLQTKPTFSLETLVDGTYTSTYETYITDQFVMRDQWIAMKVATERALQKKDINGVYFAEDEYLIQQHKNDEIDESLLDLNLNRLDQFVTEYKSQANVQVLIAPTASNVLVDKVPNNAPEFDQTDVLRRIKNMIGQEHTILVTEELKNHESEYIYYRTDHHWTSLGAYYAYTKWAEHMGETAYEKDNFVIEDVADDFLGTTYSKVNVDVTPDTIHLYSLKEAGEYTVTLNMDPNSVMNSLFDLTKLEDKDKYPVFLGGNNAHVEIVSQVKNGKTALVIKDSYAHTFVPFLANHYERIIMLDYRYFNGSTKSIIEEEQVSDILIMYNTMNFVEDKNFIKVLK